MSRQAAGSMSQGLRVLVSVISAMSRAKTCVSSSATPGSNERFPELANDRLGLKVDVILTWGIEAALAAKQATTTIPIVMGAVGDPIGSGIVTSLALGSALVWAFRDFR